MTDEAVTVAVFSQFTHHTPLTSDALHVSLAVLFVRMLFVFVGAALSWVNAALEQQSNRAVEQQQQQHFAKWTG